MKYKRQVRAKEIEREREREREREKDGECMRERKGGRDIV